MKRFSKQKTAECQIDVILLSRNFYAFFKTILWPSGVVEGELWGYLAYTTKEEPNAGSCPKM